MTNKFTVASMNQTQLVDFSLEDEDLEFAGNDAQVLAECKEFRSYLRSAGGPLLDANYSVLKFIAKGTAGWVFLTQEPSGKKVAMKLIRMTQARSGIKEWYISKILRKAGVDNVVFTGETVYVMAKTNAPPVVSDAMQTAGPVPYYMCMMQELMPWGTLEDLAKEGELSPEIMFKCLEDVAGTLAVMHAHNVQHKDVKPENIMLQMEDDTVSAAKLCDFGSANIGDNEKGRRDDIRRFGVTLFSVATGEGWTKNRLIHEKHDALVQRLGDCVNSDENAGMRRLPEVLRSILDGGISAAEVEKLMKDLADSY